MNINHISQLVENTPMRCKKKERSLFDDAVGKVNCGFIGIIRYSSVQSSSSLKAS